MVFVRVLPLLFFALACKQQSDNSDDSHDHHDHSYTNTHFSEALAKLELAPEAVKTVMDATPTTYAFTSVVDANLGSSVSYSGQTFRHVLGLDLKKYIGGLSRGVTDGTKEQTLEELNSFFEYTYDNTSTATAAINGSKNHQLAPKDTGGAAATLKEGATYDDIQAEGSQLRNKLSGIDNPMRRDSLVGFAGSSTPEELIDAWFDKIAELRVNGTDFTVENGTQGAQTISAAYITEDGLDLQQLLEKFFHGAMSFSQAADDYLRADRGLAVDNTEAGKAGAAYTALEHHWDEGFGYFGAARDYLAYSDTEIAGGGSKDSDSDGKISVKSEMNLGMSANAAKRDLGAKDLDTDFSGEIMKAFLAGRHLITSKPEGYLEYAQAQAVRALGNWEKVFAATIIHYINDVTAEMDEFGTADYLFKDHVKFWGEMKGFAMALQFSPVAILNDDGFDKLHELLGEKPVLPAAGSDALAAYKAELLEARGLLQDAYGFSATNTENW